MRSSRSTWVSWMSSASCSWNVLPSALPRLVDNPALLSFRQVYEPDLWWHLAQGRENASGSLVRSNLFSFIYPEYRQHYTSWLFDTGAFLTWQLAGGAGVQTLQFLALSATFWVLYLAGRREAPATDGCTEQSRR